MNVGTASLPCVTHALRRFAPAKINLGLSVLGLLPGGYHALHTLMVPLDVGDELEVSPAETLNLTVQGADLPHDGRNLVYRAAQAYLDAARVQAGAGIVLHKRLPLASGLGGGSSDAASTLLALAELYPARVDLHTLATRLGADVPFFLVGSPALAEGIGERLTPLSLPPLHLVLINPGTAVSAADAYRWLDETRQFTPPLDVQAIRAALEAGRPLPFFNALQAGVLARHPEIGAALTALSAAGLHSPLMSGSGSTCFALARSSEQAQQAAAELQRAYPACWIRAAEGRERSEG
ncbi:4-(cytidine 5'-diphospho)-2-C-methyl-D-erythritol kinase [Deinococcus sp.]|uniref:4-(cytidine 5'-diphospho)-2-C-methyl-D-erythritol kinase n=1 Tax=Deinococcus sp. TaxID=47478 RepID=UPI003CC6CD68